MPDISEILLEQIILIDPVNNQQSFVSEEIEQLVKDEFYRNLQLASELLGKPRFPRNVTINLTTAKQRHFNSKDSYLTFPHDLIDWTEIKPKWELFEALSHEIAHLIVGRAHGKDYDHPRVMEEGIPTYTTKKLYDYTIIPSGNYYDAMACIQDVLKEVPDLLTKWRNKDGEAPVIQDLTDDDLSNWGIPCSLRKKLLANFQYA